MPSYAHRIPTWRWLILAATLLLALAAACANHAQVFAENDVGSVHFVDADCYARMTRVREVCAHPGEIIRTHRFENYPLGTAPHTTIPFDYAVYAVRLGLLPFYGERALDLAGAWASPLLGLATVLAVWLWAERLRLRGRPFALLILAASPIVAHGFALGRPDHQSLILFCMAVALCAEWRLWRGPSRAWGVVSGIAWAGGLWTSLYEPAILLAVILLAALLWNRPALFRRDRLPGLAVSVGILALALLVEGWRIGAPPGFGEDNGAKYFAAWSQQIGELARQPPWSATLYAWTGLGLLAAPVLLALHRGPDRLIARANALLLVAVFSLTCWQARWGSFLPLVYVLGLPWQVGAIPARWRPLAAGALVLGLWPMAYEWIGRFDPSPDRSASLAEQRDETLLLRQVADFIRQDAAQNPSTDNPTAEGILASWWLSPPLAYWSGQPALAGSSHEALPGTVDVARFYLATDAREAGALLRRRRVRWVVAYEPSRVQGTSAGLLGSKPPPRFMDLVLYSYPRFAPRYLHGAMTNPYFKVYEVQVSSLPHDQ